MKKIKDLQAGEIVQFSEYFRKQIYNGWETSFSNEKGTVLKIIDNIICVRLDNHFEILNEWENQLVFSTEDEMNNIEVQIL